MKHRLLLLLLTLISASVFGQAWQDGGNGIQFRYIGDKREIRQLVKSPQPPYGVTDSLAKLEAFINKKDFLSTGLIDHAALSATIGQTTFSISAGHGVVANFDNHFYPSIKRVNITAKTGITPSFLTTAITSYIAVDSNDNVVQSASPFTDVQSRDLIILGAIVHSNLTNINAVNNIAKPVISNTNQLHDLYEAVGALNTAGNKYTANGANLNINKSAGNLFKLGVNFINDWKSPSKLTLSAQTALTFRYRTQTGTEFADRTTIDPGFYDVAGTRTAIPGSANQFTIQRITIFQSGLTRIQYGQNLFANKAEAIAALGVAPFVTETNIAENGIFRAYLVVRANATALNDLAQAEFIEVGKFGSPIGNAGGAVTSANIIAALGYTPENVANKQNSLTVDGTGVKYPTVDAVNSALSNRVTTTGGTANQLAYFNGTSGIVSYSRAKINVQGGNSTLGIGVGTPGINDPSGDAPHLFEILNDNTSQQVFSLKSYGPSVYQNNIHFLRADGTETAPTNTKSGMLFNSNGYRGYNGTGFTGSNAAFQVVATEDFTPTANGTEFRFQNTKNGTSTRIDAFQIRQSGNLWGANDVVLYESDKSPWNSVYNTFTMAGYVGVRSQIGGHNVSLFNNLYYDSSWKRASSGFGSILISDDAGGLTFYTAGTGVANSAATLATAMQVDISGNSSFLGSGTFGGKISSLTAGTDAGLFLERSGGKKWIYAADATQTYLANTTDGIIPFTISNAGNVTFSGTPTAPTPTAGDNSTKIATTAYVDNMINVSGKPIYTQTGGTGLTITTGGIVRRLGTGGIVIPSVSSSIGSEVIIVNRSAGNATILSTSGDFDTGGSITNSIVVANNATTRIINDGTNWVVVN